MEDYNPPRNLTEEDGIHRNAINLPRTLNFRTNYEMTLQNFCLPMITEAVLLYLGNPIPTILLDSASPFIRVNANRYPNLYNIMVLETTNYLDREQIILEDICHFWYNNGGEWRGPSQDNLGFINRDIIDIIITNIYIDIGNRITLQRYIYDSLNFGVKSSNFG